MACTATCQPLLTAARAIFSSAGSGVIIEAAVLRIVGVRREQGGAARAERAVGVELDAAHGEQRARPCVRGRMREQAIGVALRAEGVDAQREAPVGDEPLVDAAVVAALMPMSWISVSPSASASAWPRRIAASISAAVGSGIARSTSDIALSTKTPVGSPWASRRILPPGGSFVSRSTCAWRIAIALTQAAWPSTRSRKTGFGIWSSAACVGNLPSAKRFWSQPRPMTHAPRPPPRPAEKARRRVGAVRRPSCSRADRPWRRRSRGRRGARARRSATAPPRGRAAR